MTADTIQDSFNKAASADAPDALKVAIKELAVQVAEMAKKIPPGRAEAAARDLESLTNEALSKQPRRKWYELSAEGLIEAAKAAGEIAAPVVSCVKTILSLLAL